MRVLTFYVTFLFVGLQSHGQIWKTYSDTAQQYSKQNNYNKTVFYYEKALDALPKDSLLSNSYIQMSLALGVVYAKAQDFGNAEKLFLSAKNVSESLYGQKADYAKACTFLGNVYTNSNQFSKAESNFKEALQIREKIFTMESQQYAQTCNNLASLYWSLGELEKAESLAKQSLQIRKQLLPSGNPAIAISCVNLGDIYRDMKQYDKAEALYIEAKDIRKKDTADISSYAASCNILADLYYYEQRYDKAKPLYIEAKTIYQKIYSDKSQLYAQSCNNLASLLREVGELEESEKLFLEAREIWKDDTNNPNTPINASGLGELYFKKGDFKKSDDYFKQAQALWRQTLGNTHPFLVQNTSNLGKVYWNLNDNRKANAYFLSSFNGEFDLIKSFFQFTTETEKENYLHNLFLNQDDLFSFYYHTSPLLAGDAYNVALKYRNLILSSTQSFNDILNNTSDSEIKNHFKTWISLKQNIARLYSKGVPTNAPVVVALSDSAGALEKKLVKRIKLPNATNTTWKDVQKELKQDEAAIEFISFNDYRKNHFSDSVLYAALLLKHNERQPIFVPLFYERELDSLMRRSTYVNLYTRGVGVKNTAQSHFALYKLIWAHLDKYLSGIDKIYYAPSGLLHKVSFAGLKNGKVYLCDKYQLVRLNSTASILDQSSQVLDKGDDIQLFGDINYDKSSDSITFVHGVHSTRSLPEDLRGSESWPQLPGTKLEINSIERLAISKHQVSAIRGEQATEQSFKSLRGTHSPAIIHIATHGFFFSQPKRKDSINLIGGNAFKQSDNPLFRSGLIFAGANECWKGKEVQTPEDGILTAFEVSNLYLAHTKLVVLSACETGLGDVEGAEGVYGLQRSFKIAGVKNLVMSLWKVPDMETAIFMKNFYTDLFKGEPIDKAFYEAQTFMRKQYTNEPYKWAGWILIH